MSAYIAFVIGLAIGAGVALLVLSLLVVGRMGEQDLPEPPQPRQYQD